MKILRKNESICEKNAITKWNNALFRRENDGFRKFTFYIFFRRKMQILRKNESICEKNAITKWNNTLFKRENAIGCEIMMNCEFRLYILCDEEMKIHRKMNACTRIILW